MNKLRGILISTAILSGVLLATEGVSAKDNHLFVIQTFAQKPISEKDFNESDINSEKESALKKIQEMNLKDRVSEFNERIESGYTRAEISKILDEAKSVSDSNNKSDDEAKQKEEEKKKSRQKKQRRRKLSKHQLKVLLHLRRVRITLLWQPHVLGTKDCNLKLQNLKKKLLMCLE